MVIDVDVQNNYYNVFSGFFCSICAIFLIILIRPLYYFSKERKALLILFSKVWGFFLDILGVCQWKHLKIDPIQFFLEFKLGIVFRNIFSERNNFGLFEF